MDWRRSDDSAERFSAYLDEIAGVMGHAARMHLPDAATTARGCCWIARGRARSRSQRRRPPTRPARSISRCLHFLAKGEWSDEKVLGKVRDLVLPQMDASRADRGLDHRRHELSEYVGRTRSAFRTNTAASSASRPIARSPSHCRWPITRASLPVALSAVSSRELGEGPMSAAGRPAFPMSIAVSDQAEDRASADRMGVCGRPCARRGGDGLRAYGSAFVAAPAPHARSSLPMRWGCGRRTLGAQARERGSDNKPVTAADLAGSLCEAALGARSAGATAPTRGSRSRFAARAGARRRRGHDHRGARGVADRRVAEGREGAHRNSGCPRWPQDIDFARIDRYHHAALAHRARLSGAQAGGGARPFRRREAGAASTITPPLCIAAYRFLVAERGAFPPPRLAPDTSSKNLPFPKVTNPEAPPLRPERHVPHSIAKRAAAVGYSLSAYTARAKIKCCTLTRLRAL